MDQFLTVKGMPKSVKVLSCLLSLILAYLFLINHAPLEDDFESNYADFQSSFSNHMRTATQELQNLRVHFEEAEGSLPKHHFYLEELYEHEGISLFVFEKDEVIFWSEDQTSIKNELLSEKNGLYHSGSGLYFKRIEKSDLYTFVSLIQLTYDFDYENKYLENRFAKDFDFQTIGSIGVSESNFPIFDLNGQAVFYLKKKETSEAASKYPLLEFIGFLLFILNTVWFLPSLFLNRHPLVRKLIISLLLIFLRLFLFIQLPPAIATASLYQAEFYALSQYVPSLGDLLLHVLVFFFLLILWKGSLVRIKKIFLPLILLLTLFFGHWILVLVEMSVEQSQISFQLSDLIGIDILSLVFFVTLGLLLLSFYLLLDVCAILLKQFCTKRSTLYIQLLIYLLFIGLYLFSFVHWIYLWIPISFSFCILIRQQKSKNYLLYSVGLLLMSASAVTYLIHQNIAKKELTAQKIYLTKLSEENDPILEYLFDGAKQEIREDQRLKQLAKNYWSNKEMVDDYIIETHFQAYWNQYQIQLSLCKSQDSIYISNWEISTSCTDYYEERIKNESKNEAVDNLFQLKNLVGRIDYIGKVKISTDISDFTLYIELGRNLINTNEGYPELLLEENTNLSDVLNADYSYAVYSKNQLVYKVGDYNYSTELKEEYIQPNVFSQSVKDNFQHTKFQKDGQTSLVLSHELTDDVSKITGVAYLFLLIGLLFLFFSLVSSSFMLPLKLKVDHFTTKVQLFLVGSLLTALFGLALGTSYFIKNQYQEKNRKQLAEKLRSLSIEIESKIGGEDFLSPQLEEYVATKLIQFSNVFYTDINIYDTLGSLYSTSRPEIFDKGLKSDRINPSAYAALQMDKRSEWNQIERIGNLNYMSAYVPLINYDNQVLGYLNLPYFAKQGQFQKEISAFLASTLNIYVGIFLIALLISVFLIEQIAKPLRLLKNQIGKLKIGSSIDLIDWKSNDEIGALVSEYNRIAIELNESADQLAKSEREIAWREMAKQVAHEIKNPLTPIKLSIQHLQRAEYKDAEAMKAQIDRTAGIIIDQIDSLSKIASAFSSFAKLPEGKLEELDLMPILENTINLYASEANISLMNETESSLLLMGNKDYLIRLFNNLLKNAIQASEHLDNKKIEVIVKKVNHTIRVEIKDFGQGISEELGQRIFEPNFTTKSKGTGLGLAMSKSIVEHLKGKIGFHSLLEKETIFWVELPLIKEANTSE